LRIPKFILELAHATVQMLDGFSIVVSTSYLLSESSAVERVSVCARISETSFTIRRSSSFWAMLLVGHVVNPV
jgi:hypothetical protein